MSFRMLLYQGDHHLRRHLTHPADYTERDQLPVSKPVFVLDYLINKAQGN